VDTLQDALIVIDHRGYVADLNPAALTNINSNYNESIRKPATLVLKHWPYLVDRFKQGIQSVEPIYCQTWRQTRAHYFKQQPHSTIGKPYLVK